MPNLLEWPNMYKELTPATPFQRKIRPFAFVAVSVAIAVAGLITEAVASVVVRAIFNIPW